MQRQGRRQVLGEDVARRLGVGPLDLDLHVEAAGPQDRRVDHVLAVGGADHDDVLEALDAVDLAEQLRDDGVLDVGGDAGAAGAEQRVHLVEEHDDRRALAGLLARALEHQPDVPLGLADVLVEQLGALDVEEVRLALLAGLVGDLLGQRVGDRLGDQRLAAAGRAVEQHALRRLELVLLEQLGVQVRAARSRRGSGRSAASGHRCWRSRCRGPLRGRAPRPRSSGSARRCSWRGCRAAPSRRRAELLDRSGSAIRTTFSSSAFAITRARSPSARISLSITTSPTSSNSRAATTLRASLSMTSWPRSRSSTSTFGLTLTRSLRPPVKTSTVSSSLRAEEGAEAGRRLREPVDLFLQRHDLVAGLAQGGRRALVLRGQRREGRLGLGEPLLEVAGRLRARR